jgi:predicted acylesterase/phospholipase RssA
MADSDLEKAKRRAQELVDASYPPTPTQECDVVMKGGITSGIVYPLVVCELAKTYRFRSIGGASAGAIAATMAAAAECGRSTNSFSRLARLPEELGGTLTRLFQPQAGTKPLFDVLLAAVGPAGTVAEKVRRTLFTFIRRRPVWFVGGGLLLYVLAVPGLLVTGGLPDDTSAWGQLVLAAALLVPVAFVSGLLAALAGHVLGGLRGLGRNYYGLCVGSAGGGTDAGIGPMHLTDWMAATLDGLAGLPLGSGPLTFRHLWERPDGAINLQVMTTNVTFGRPARFPFSDEASNLKVYMFCEKELIDFFPKPVYDHLIGNGPVHPSWSCPDHGCPLRRLPLPEDLPVVVATRISLSFPGLISAVPLFAVDRSAKIPAPVRCWFSDGGITSNFPIHFFDALCPSRPTFGITLRPYHPDYPETDVYRPGPAATGRVPTVKNTGTVGGFLHAILDTMQNWSDDAQSALPGFRDRVVDLHLHDDEGGMNLAMPANTIAVVAERGRQAAEALADFDWAQHRWTRYLTAMSELEQQTVKLGAVMGNGSDGSGGYRELVTTYGPAETADGPNHFYRHTEAWCEAAAGKTEKVIKAMAPTPGHDFITSDPAPPRPDPDLRVTPHF